MIFRGAGTQCTTLLAKLDYIVNSWPFDYHQLNMTTDSGALIEQPLK